MKIITKKALILLCMLSFINNVFGQEKSGFKKVDRILESLIRKKKVPGIAVTVTKKGIEKYSKGFGYADIEKKITINPNKTVFRIGSLSKPIAASGLLKLVEKNQISLNDSIYKCIPYFPNKKYNFTIKQLGGHLAGIRNYKGNEFMNNDSLSIKEGVKLFQDDPLLFKPGTDYFYTSYSWNLLSLAMQEVSRKPFEDIIKEEVLHPLNMFNTFPDKQEKIDNKAVFYRKKRRRKFIEVSAVHNFFKLAGGGYLSTSKDISELGNAYLNNEFFTDDLKHEFVTSQHIQNKLTYYGIGWQVSYDKENRPYFGHIGNGLGGYGIFYVYPKEEIVISILMNCSNPKQEKRLDKVISEIFKELNFK
jgi:CubicO group peptidase (beta-lactamase class C family)